MGATCTTIKAKKKTRSQGTQTDRSDIYKVDETGVVVVFNSAEEREAKRKDLYQRVK